ncbi:MAG: hypothetical protein CMQ29_12175 [Gammaproteobacteria bacterium]|nr:hypothetical protein [Gammaproteobacteria bacterium]
MTTAHLARGVTLLALFTLGQCSEPTSTRNQSTTSPPDLGAILPEAHAALHEAVATGSLLNAAITRFLNSPDEPNRESAVTARHTAHDAWLSAWAPAALWAGNDIHYVAFRIDAWPITPGFLDTLPQYPQSGIVADVSLPLNVDSIQKQHGFSDPLEVALGFHAIQLLLDRPVRDYNGAAEQIKRRRELLRLQSEILLGDLQALAQTPPISLGMTGLLEASIATLSEALRMATRDTGKTDCKSAWRGDSYRALELLTAPVVNWLEREGLRRWSLAIDPKAAANLTETLKMMTSPPGPTSTPTNYAAIGAEAPTTATAPTPPLVNQTELALRATLQILKGIIQKASRSRTGP